MFTLKKLLDKEISFDFTGFIPKLFEMMEQVLENDNLKSFLADTTQQFDVAIVEWLYSDVYAG